MRWFVYLFTRCIHHTHTHWYRRLHASPGKDASQQQPATRSGYEANKCKLKPKHLIHLSDFGRAKAKQDSRSCSRGPQQSGFGTDGFATCCALAGKSCVIYYFAPCTLRCFIRARTDGPQTSGCWLVAKQWCKKAAGGRREPTCQGMPANQPASQSGSIYIAGC